MKGGKQVAYGSFGCVFKPQLLCKGQSVRGDGVSKLMERKEAIGELSEQKYVDEVIDPGFKYHLRPPKMCEIGDLDETQDDLKDCPLFRLGVPSDVRKDYAILQMENGGVSIQAYLSKLYESPGLRTMKNMMDFIFGMENLFKGIVDFKNNKFIHFDIKPGNIVYREETNRFNFIDFGLGIKSDDINNVVHNRNNMFTSGYFIMPIELAFLVRDLKVNRVEDIAKKIYGKNKSSYKTTNASFAASDIYLKPLLDNIQIYDEIFKIDKRNVARYMFDKIDVYSLGITLMQIIVVFTSSKFRYNFFNAERDFIDEISNLVRDMINPVATLRLTADKAYSNLLKLKEKYGYTLPPFDTTTTPPRIPSPPVEAPAAASAYQPPSPAYPAPAYPSPISPAYAAPSGYGSATPRIPLPPVVGPAAAASGYGSSTPRIPLPPVVRPAAAASGEPRVRGTIRPRSIFSPQRRAVIPRRLITQEAISPVSSRGSVSPPRESPREKMLMSLSPDCPQGSRTCGISGGKKYRKKRTIRYNKRKPKGKKRNTIKRRHKKNKKLTQKNI